MNKSDLVKAWIIKAEGDIKNIVNNLKFVDEEIPVDTICFHCQQAIEKYLKAFLIYKEVSFPYTHNLGTLVHIAENIDPCFCEIKEKAELLTPFAVEIRYPDFSDIPSIEECKELFNIVIEIKEFIIQRIS